MAKVLCATCMREIKEKDKYYILNFSPVNDYKERNAFFDMCESCTQSMLDHMNKLMEKHYYKNVLIYKRAKEDEK